MIEYIDSHCHLDFADFDKDREAVIASCEAKGIKTILVPGIEPAQWPALGPLCESHTGLRFAVGLHPWWVEANLGMLSEPGRAQSTESLTGCLSSKHCLAIGECGLDANIDLPLSQQVGVLEWQLKLALEAERPVILHCVKAHNQLLESLKKFKGLRGVIHAFSGSVELAQQYWRKGFYLGAGGVITYPRGSKTRAAFSALPAEAILLETDAPDMPLNGQQGQRNTPENIPKVAQTLAELRGCDVSEVAGQTTENFACLFL